MTAYLQTGQVRCYDSEGGQTPCTGSGQDGELRLGKAWPRPGFLERGAGIEDRLTGLVWSKDANPAQFPLNWAEAEAFIAQINRRAWLDHSHWRVPSRTELRSLLSFQTRRPALPEGHPFLGVFPSWYWTSTEVAVRPGHAWYVNLDGARTFFGGKEQSFFLWPVRSGGVEVDPATDSEPGLHAGPRRLRMTAGGLEDRVTGLLWHPNAGGGASPMTWAEALAAIQSLGEDWQLPNINELDSLVDCTARGTRALHAGYERLDVKEGYWSSTTSAFEPDWAWALYTETGGIGVGQKKGCHFHAWAVRDLPGAGCQAQRPGESTIQRDGLSFGHPSGGRHAQ